MRDRDARLGSCVAIMLHDPTARVGAMAHVLLRPRVSPRHGEPCQIPETAVPLMLEP